MQKSTSRTELQKRRKSKNIKSQKIQRRRELRNKGIESLVVSPQALAQSKRELEKRASNWSSNLSKSSNVRQLRSLQIHHIKHSGTRFQMEDECFPSQFHQLNRKSLTIQEGTQEIPKILKTKHRSQ